MIQKKYAIRSEEVGFKHILFVEGSNEAAIDPEVLRVLLDGINISVRPLGASYSIHSVAQALHKSHPTYYFLIDRDHREDEFIDMCWNNFQNPETNNLLVWRKREIENYFLDPAFLSKSGYFTKNQDELTEEILKHSNQRLYLDAANHVVISIREELKNNWIKIFKNPEAFRTKEKALQKLHEAQEFNDFQASVADKVSSTEITKRFGDAIQRMTGGTTPLTMNQGEWLNMVQGKALLNKIINSGCFCVEDQQGNIITGSQKLNEIAKDLLRQEDNVLPEDFKTLRALIKKRVSITHP